MNRFRPIFLYLGLLLGLNIIFVAIHYLADAKVSPEFVQSKIKIGLHRGSLSEDNYPMFKYGLPSTRSTIGIDHYTDCVIDLMALYRAPAPLKNAIVPGFYSNNASKPCIERKEIAEQTLPLENARIAYKARLWHGAKPFLLISLTKLNYFQVSEFIKLSSYFLYGLIGVLIALQSRNALIAYIPIMFGGIFGAGILVHGGISNALPHLSVLVTIALVLFAGLTRFKQTLLPYLLFAAGCVQAFVYVLDGSLMLLYAMLGFVLYFVIYAQATLKTQTLILTKLGAIYLAGFILTFLLKQLISGLYLTPDSVWSSFWNKIVYRISGDIHGNEVSMLDAITKQFEWYRLAMLDWRLMVDLFKWMAVICWPIAFVIGILRYFRNKDIKPLLGVLALTLFSSVVILRFGFMANHSHIHTIIVSRYLFIPIYFGISALIFSIFYRKPDELPRYPSP